MSSAVISSFSVSRCAQIKSSLSAEAVALSIAFNVISLPTSNDVSVSGNATLPRKGTMDNIFVLCICFSV